MSNKRRSWHWIFGSNCHINFSTGVGVAQSGPSDPILISQNEGCDTVSDRKTGELIFHTNGIKVWNKNYVEISSGDILSGSPNLEPNLAVQAITVLLKPGSTSEYILIFVGNWGVTSTDYREIRYRTLNVVTWTYSTVNVLGTTTASSGYAENLTACIQDNGTDFWVITKMKGNNVIRIWPLTSSGFGAPIDRTISFNTSGNNRYGQIKVSPDGKRLVLGFGGEVTSVGSNPVLTVWDFDNSNASISNERILLSGDGSNEQLANIVGVDFSPNSSVIYASTNISGVNSIVYKVVLWNSVDYSIYTTTNTLTRGAVQLGPDGYMYFACSGQDFIKRIYTPNDDFPGISLNTLDISNNDVPGGSQSTSFLGLPVVPQIQDAPNDYRVFYEGTWYSVCNGDDIRFYDVTTDSWLQLSEGDKFWDGIAWTAISCSLPTQLNYSVVNIANFFRPENEGYDPPWNSNSFTGMRVPLGTTILGTVRIIGPLYDGFYTVVSYSTVGSFVEVIFQQSYLGTNSESKLIEL